MYTSGNKGEWSELYALFKLLSDGKLSAGDEHLNQIRNLIYPILNIIRKDTEGDINYCLDNDVVIITTSSVELLRIPVNKFTENAHLLLSKILENNTSAFSVPEISLFRLHIHADKIKADSRDKTDITIVVHDSRTGQKPVLGFSIKSELGSAPTLLNSSSTTNFIYSLTNCLDKETVSAVNATKHFHDKLIMIYQRHCSLKFRMIEPSVQSGNMFHNNLVLVDSCMPYLLAEMLKDKYLYDKSSIADLIEIENRNNPFGFDMSEHHQFYECKMKRLLTDIALGMTPAHLWNGVYEANGGYLVVKDTGDIVCYHIYNKKEFEDYLFTNTMLDTPSSSRHHFGQIETQDDGSQIMKLNLQIRFIK